MAFYGSLMRGLGGADELGIGLRFVSNCEIPGQLIDLGDYPGLLTGPGRVLGELFEVLEPETLAQLDRFEGFDPTDRQGSLYLREAVPLISPRQMASIYRYNQARDGYPQVISGDWRAHLAQRPR